MGNDYYCCISNMKFQHILIMNFMIESNREGWVTGEGLRYTCVCVRVCMKGGGGVFHQLKRPINTIINLSTFVR